MFRAASNLFRISEWENLWSPVTTGWVILIGWSNPELAVLCSAPRIDRSSLWRWFINVKTIHSIEIHIKSTQNITSHMRKIPSLVNVWRNLSENGLGPPLIITWLLGHPQSICFPSFNQTPTKFQCCHFRPNESFAVGIDYLPMQNLFN